MAKLEGVKVLDMENGEVTKIEYEGAEYSRVPEGEKPDKGDIYVAIVDAKDVDKGAYYKIVDLNLLGFPVFIDNALERSVVNIEAEGNDVFLRAEVEPVFESGDKVRSKSFPAMEFVLTERFPSMDGIGYGKAWKHDRGPGWIGEDQVELVSKASDQFTKVDRNANPGDFIKFNEIGIFVKEYLTEGKYYEVTRLDACFDPQIKDDDGDEFDLAGEDYDVFEKVSDKVPEDHYVKFPVGTKVKLNIPEGRRPRFDWGNVKNGEIGTVVGHRKKNFAGKEIVKVDFPSQENWSATPDELVAEETREIPELKVGDLAVVERTRHITMNGFNVGDLVKVIGNEFGSDDSVFKIERDGIIGYAPKKGGYLAKVTEEMAKLAKIGRKPGEYKKGDIVATKRRDGDDITGKVEAVVSDAIGVEDFSGMDYRGVYFYKGDEATLITPVEHRFDRP